MGISFAERLLQIRLDKNLSQDAMAALCGVGKRSQLHYEKGERLPDIAYLQNLTGQLKQLKSPIDLIYLVTGETTDATELLSEDELALITAYRSATSEGKATIKQVAGMAAKKIPAPENAPVKAITPRVKKTIKMADAKQVASGSGASIQVGGSVKGSTVFNGGIDGNSVADRKRATPTSGARRKRG